MNQTTQISILMGCSSIIYIHGRRLSKVDFINDLSNYIDSVLFKINVINRRTIDIIQILLIICT